MRQDRLREEGDVKTEAETGVRQPQAKEGLQPQKLEETGGVLSEPSKGEPLPLTLDFRPPEAERGGNSAALRCPAHHHASLQPQDTDTAVREGGGRTGQRKLSGRGCRPDRFRLLHRGLRTQAPLEESCVRQKRPGPRTAAMQSTAGARQSRAAQD